MNNDSKTGGGVLFNLVVLLFSFLGLILIIFLKLGVGKKGEQSLPQSLPSKSRVKTSNKNITNIEGLNERQLEILREVSKKGGLLPKEIYSLYPKISTRTLRRDMDFLVLKKLVKQQGNTKSTKYIYIGG